jgi:GDPmannose 4,6-dehydratase
MKRKRAIITGVTGQDGSYLAELLLQKGYDVFGMKRRSSSLNTGRIDHLYIDPHELRDGPTFRLFHGDITDGSAIASAIHKYEPDEIYNLAAQSHVAVSFEQPEYTAMSDAFGPLKILESVLQSNRANKIKFYQASTSEMYGGIYDEAQNEKTPFYPKSPYGAAKLYAHTITVNYRESHSLFACSGILFNHESPRRGETFVTRKITRGLARYVLGIDNTIYLGNLYAKRDWGHAKDYVRAMWLMMQQEVPRDYVIATGKQYSVKDFVNRALEHMSIPAEWQGSGVEEKCIDTRNGNTVVAVDPRYFRPSEVDSLLGDASAAMEILGWKPEIDFSELVEEMCESDMKNEKKALNL